MHKRKVLMFFGFLLVFAIVLLTIQKINSHGLNGNAVIERDTSSNQIPFNIKIDSVNIKENTAIVNIIAYSDSSTILKLDSYLSEEGNIISSTYGEMSLSSGIATKYSLFLDLPHKTTNGKVILYATDGKNDIRIVYDASIYGINGRVVSDSKSAVFSIWAALVLCGVIILIIIVFGIVLNKHRKQSNRIELEQEKRKFIKIDIN